MASEIAPAVGRATRPGTVAHALEELAGVLQHAGVPEARAEARDLVAALLDVPRFWPSANRDAELDAETLLLARRAVRVRRPARRVPAPHAGRGRARAHPAAGDGGARGPRARGRARAGRGG